MQAELEQFRATTTVRTPNGETTHFRSESKRRLYVDGGLVEIRDEGKGSVFVPLTNVSHFVVKLAEAKPQAKK